VQLSYELSGFIYILDVPLSSLTAKPRSHAVS
jgi:hypothetical protein